MRAPRFCGNGNKSNGRNDERYDDDERDDDVVGESIRRGVDARVRGARARCGCARSRGDDEMNE